MKTRIGKKHTPLVIGNWKMNPATLLKAQELFSGMKKALGKKESITQICIAAPFPYIALLEKRTQKSRIALGAQDVSHEEIGAYTGEVAVSMLKSIGVSYVIAGHSERRALGESDDRVAQKAVRILKSGLTAVVCVGEKIRDTEGDYFGIVESQLRAVLKSLPPSALGRFVIAYEPIWAIGTGKHATPEDVQEMKLFIQKVLAQTIHRNAVSKVRILYGGSVTKDNAEALLNTGRVDGFLVGGASLKIEELSSIVNIADVYGK